MAASSSRALLSSTSMKWAIGGWSFFIAENTILSENRTTLISNFGDDMYHICYGTLSTAAMSSVFYGYFKKVKHAQPLLWGLNAPAPLGATPVTRADSRFAASQREQAVVAREQAQERQANTFTIPEFVKDNKKDK